MGFGGREESELEGEISSNDFYPTIQLSEFQTVMRIDNSFRDEAIKHRVTEAVIHVNHSLSDEIIDWQAAGFQKLADVLPLDTVNDEAVLVFKYKHAVFSYAKASLMKDFGTMNRRDEGENMAKESEETEEHYLAECESAINFMVSGDEGNLNVYSL